jgi:hypothetical protein
MDFTLSSEQTALADALAQFISRGYRFEDRVATLKSGASFNREHWKTFADLGWFGAGLAEEAGGYGGDAVENAIIMEAFGRALVIEPFLTHAIHALQTLNALPNSQLRGELIEAGVSGEQLLTVAYDEPDAWGDAGCVATRATPSGQSFRISGCKSRVIAASDADVLVVTARTSGTVDSRTGMELFVIPRNALGLRRVDYRLVDDTRAADVWLDNVEARLLPAEGRALAAIETGLAHAVTAACAETVGAMESALWSTRDYLKGRKQFGAPLGTFQALQHRMADMLVQTELARSMLFQGLAALAAPPGERDKRISASKVAVSRAGLFVTGNAIQLHGAIGVTDESSIGHYYKRVWVLASMFGDCNHHLAAFMSSSRIEPLPPDAVIAEHA